MPLLDLKTALSRLPDDEHSQRIRRLADDASDGLADTSHCVLQYARNVKGLELYHHDALIALLAEEKGSSAQATDYASGMCIQPTADQIDTLVSLFTSPDALFASLHASEFAARLAHSFPNQLSEAQHARLLDVICNAGESMDVEAYADAYCQATTSEMHDKVIQLFRRDTYHGPACAARYVRKRELSMVHHSYLIAAITGGVRKRSTVHLLKEFLRNVRGLSPHLVESILKGMIEHGAKAEDYRFILECGTDLTPEVEERILRQVRVACESEERPRPEAGASGFDPDEIIV